MGYNPRRGELVLVHLLDLADELMEVRPMVVVQVNEDHILVQNEVMPTGRQIQIRREFVFKDTKLHRILYA